tara:strand:+ start:220 stop:519 length:300 start_codon:yes stop_codon:yes gene_type:complete
LYIKKILKNDINIKKDKITICEFSFNILDKSFTGKKPPEEISVKAKFNESNDLIEKKFNITKTVKVNPEYNKKILIACFNTSELFKEIKLVKVFLKLSS